MVNQILIKVLFLICFYSWIQLKRSFILFFKCLFLVTFYYAFEIGEVCLSVFEKLLILRFNVVKIEIWNLTILQPFFIFSLLSGIRFPILFYWWPYWSHYSFFHWWLFSLRHNITSQPWKRRSLLCISSIKTLVIFLNNIF